jgi:hypothetical protein
MAVSIESLHHLFSINIFANSARNPRWGKAFHGTLNYQSNACIFRVEYQIHQQTLRRSSAAPFVRPLSCQSLNSFCLTKHNMAAAVVVSSSYLDILNTMDSEPHKPSRRSTSSTPAPHHWRALHQSYDCCQYTQEQLSLTVLIDLSMIDTATKKRAFAALCKKNKSLIQN